MATTPKPDQVDVILPGGGVLSVPAEMADKIKSFDLAAEPEASNVIEAIRRVMRDIPGIVKKRHEGDDPSKGIKYAYRSIEEVTPHTQSLFARHGVVIVPRVVGFEIRPITVNNNPWMDVVQQVEYDLYGPGGIEDKITLGPIIGIGRDNSDKGANKALTQALKYALIQVLQIADNKADADNEEAHVADAPRAPGEQRRLDLTARIRGASPEILQAVVAFCDTHQIPKSTTQMDDGQVAQVEDYLTEAEAMLTAEPVESAPQSESPQSVDKPVDDSSQGTLAMATPDTNVVAAAIDSAVTEIEAQVIAKVGKMATATVLAELKLAGENVVGTPDVLKERLVAFLVKQQVA